MQINSKEIRKNLELLEQSISDAKELEQSFNLYVINTPKKQIRIKSTLSEKEFLKTLKNNDKQ